MMRALAALAIWIAGVAGAVAADRSQQGRISRAAVWDGKLWYINGGALWSADLDAQSVMQHGPDGMALLAAGSGTLWAARVDQPQTKPDGKAALTVQRVCPDGVLGAPAIRRDLAAGERLIDIVVLEGEAWALTTRALVTSKSGAPAVAVDLDKAPVGWPMGAAVPKAAQGDVYFASDAGEWGGSLLRFNVRTGKGETSKSADAKDLCEGVLNPACDPVTSVIADPKRPDCVLASVGLRHLLERGKIVRACPQGVELVFETSQDGGPNGTAIFGLAPSASGFWAVSAREAFKFEDGKLTRRMPLKFEATGSGLDIARPDKEIIVVLTDLRVSSSLSGRTPILVSTLP